jgi:nucleotide-binding universal stress UspA family protein
MIVICYDGSAGARAAVDLAAKTMPGAEATVVAVWEAFLDMVARNGAIAGDWLAPAAGEDYERLDAASEQAAQDIADEGVQRAQAAGLNAHALVARRHGETGEAILEAAAEVDAEIIFVGSRGRGDVKSFLLGSVSHYLVHHADRAVSVVPTSEMADRRRSALH